MWLLKLENAITKILNGTYYFFPIDPPTSEKNENTFSGFWGGGKYGTWLGTVVVILVVFYDKLCI